jgi:hypothetical protein
MVRLRLLVSPFAAGGALALLTPLARAGVEVPPREGTTPVTAPAEPPSTAPAELPPTPALAAEAPGPFAPRVHHAPLAVAAANHPFEPRVEVDHPELVKRVLLVYRAGSAGPLREVPFRRGAPSEFTGSAAYLAEVPAALVVGHTLEYAIELEALDGTRARVFASRDRLHRVQVAPDMADEREKALSARHEDRRSVASASAEYVYFGTTSVDSTNADGSASTLELRDAYFRVEAAYTYRVFEFVSEFSLRAGIVRGRSPVPVTEELAPGQQPEDRFDVGLNYGSPMVRFRLADVFHVEAELLTSVTEVGFSAGTGGALLFGDAYGSKLTVGFETVKTFGTRFYSRTDIVASRRIRVAPIIEITNMPHADDYGVRLLGEVDVSLPGGFGFALRGGYQARVFTAGGPGAGLTLRYAF